MEDAIAGTLFGIPDLVFASKQLERGLEGQWIFHLSSIVFVVEYMSAGVEKPSLEWKSKFHFALEEFVWQKVPDDLLLMDVAGMLRNSVALVQNLEKFGQILDQFAVEFDKDKHMDRHKGKDMGMDKDMDKGNDYFEIDLNLRFDLGYFDSNASVG